jgi:hypothetical protein
MHSAKVAGDRPGPRSRWPAWRYAMITSMVETNAVEGDLPAPKLLGTWITIQQAELMLGHVRTAGATWPDVAIYLHSCITAIRSVTLTMQKALAHEQGFRQWYEIERAKLAGDGEMQYLLEARNHVLKRGALSLMHAYEFSYSGGLGIEVRGVGPDGPDVWIPNAENPDQMVPVDWRKLEGLEFNVPLRFGRVEGLPDPPDREVRELLEEKIGRLRLMALDAEERFDPEAFDAEEAAKQRTMLAPLRRVDLPSG